jgi:hypothetical protein
MALFTPSINSHCLNLLSSPRLIQGARQSKALNNILYYFASLAMMILVIMLVCFSLPAFAATTIPFTINLSKAVNVTGTPQIALDIDGITPPRYATYTSGSGTSTLTFTYTMVAGDVDLDGITLTTSIDLNGGTIKDLVGNDLSPLTFTAPNTTNVKVNYPSLGMDFIYDSDGRYTLNGTIYNDLTSFLSAASGTFTRASVGTDYDSAGVLQTSASGIPRFDYDPATHAAKGILIEESRANLLTNSGSPSSWAAGIYHATVGSTAYNAPNGAALAREIISTATDGMVPSNAVTGAFTTYTVSIYAKKGVGNGFRIEAVAGIDSAFSGAYAKFDFSTNTASLDGAYTGKITGISASMQDVGNGWFRCIFTYSITGTSFTNGFYQRFHPLLSTGVVGNSVILWGYQLEQATFATSYIPTTSAAVTRAADVLTIPTGSWYNSTEGAFYAAVNPGSNAANETWVSFLQGNLSTDSQFIFREGGNLNAFNFTGGTGGRITGSVAYASAAKAAFGYKNADMGYSVNGNMTTATYNMPVGLSSLRIGAFSTGNRYLNGWEKSFKYYPLRVSNAQLQLMTQ